MDTLEKRYKEKIAKELQTKLGVTNVMAIPAMKKIVVNMGVKDAVLDKKHVTKAVDVMTQITGQKPKVVKSKKSIATFKLREGDPIGVVVTLHGKRMYEFLEKIIDIVLPRIKDFRGVSRTSFDGHGNYALGFPEYAVFPEIDLSTVDRIQGLEVIVVTNAGTDEKGFALMEALGIPFMKEK